MAVTHTKCHSPCCLPTAQNTAITGRILMKVGVGQTKWQLGKHIQSELNQTIPSPFVSLQEHTVEYVTGLVSYENVRFEVSIVVLLIQVFLDVKLVTGITVPYVLKENTAFTMLENSNPATQFTTQENAILKSTQRTNHTSRYPSQSL